MTYFLFIKSAQENNEISCYKFIKIFPKRQQKHTVYSFREVGH